MTVILSVHVVRVTMELFRQANATSCYSTGSFNSIISGVGISCPVFDVYFA